MQKRTPNTDSINYSSYVSAILRHYSGAHKMIIATVLEKRVIFRWRHTCSIKVNTKCYLQSAGLEWNSSERFLPPE